MSTKTATELIVDRSPSNELLKVNFNIRRAAAGWLLPMLVLGSRRMCRVWGGRVRRSWGRLVLICLACSSGSKRRHSRRRC